MLLVEIMRVALEAIRSHKLRSLLTMLGIVIGVAAVITMVALGEGAKRAIQEQIASLGTNVLTVRPGQLQAMVTAEPRQLVRYNAGTIREVTIGDGRLFEETLNKTSQAQLGLLGAAPARRRASSCGNHRRAEWPPPRRRGRRSSRRLRRCSSTRSS